MRLSNVAFEWSLEPGAATLLSVSGIPRRVVSLVLLIGLAAASWAGLKAWNGWLELKRFELTHDSADRTLPPATGRIELADLRERVRKLEAIAAGIDL